jgi:polar amino acid transport system substrate-binding protein
MAARAGRVITVAGWILAWFLPLLAAVTAGVLIVGVRLLPDRPPPAPQLFTSGVIRIGIDASYPPFAVSEDGQLSGLEIDLGLALGERIGLPVSFTNMGYDGLYDSLLADQVDIVISQLIVNPLRMGDVKYTRAYYDAGLVLISPAEAPILTLEALPDRSLAYEFGSLADHEMRRWSRRIAQFEAHPYELPSHALDAVRLGLAAASLVDSTSARLYLRQRRDWEPMMTFATHTPYAIAVRLDRPDVWHVIDSHLADMLADGTIAALIDHWL